MDVLITLIVELSLIIGRRVARFLNLTDISEEIEMIIGLIFISILIIIFISLGISILGSESE